MRPFFFFDTADVDFISETFNDLVKIGVEPSSCIGVTTNPNALHKVKVDTLDDFKSYLPKLVKTVTDLDSVKQGRIVFVQLPYSFMDLQDIVSWSNFIQGFADDKTKIGLKIPHYPDVAKFVNDLNFIDNLDGNIFDHVSLNVTGISDWGTLLSVSQYENIEFVSLLMGRMDEDDKHNSRSIDHLDFYRSSVNPNNLKEVIAGSLRTVGGMLSAAQRAAIPTIGTSLWHAIKKEGYKKVFDEWSSMEVSHPRTDIIFPPETSDGLINISQKFFKQMDELGYPMGYEFIASLKNEKI